MDHSSQPTTLAFCLLEHCNSVLQVTSLQVPGFLWAATGLSDEDEDVAEIIVGDTLDDFVPSLWFDVCFVSSRFGWGCRHSLERRQRDVLVVGEPSKAGLHGAGYIVTCSWHLRYLSSNSVRWNAGHRREVFRCALEIASGAPHKTSALTPFAADRELLNHRAGPVLVARSLEVAPLGEGNIPVGTKINLLASMMYIPAVPQLFEEGFSHITPI